MYRHPNQDSALVHLRDAQTLLDVAQQEHDIGHADKRDGYLRLAEAHAAIASALAQVALLDAIQNLTRTIDPDRGG